MLLKKSQPFHADIKTGCRCQQAHWLKLDVMGAFREQAPAEILLGFQRIGAGVASRRFDSQSVLFPLYWIFVARCLASGLGKGNLQLTSSINPLAKKLKLFSQNPSNRKSFTYNLGTIKLDKDHNGQYMTIHENTVCTRRFYKCRLSRSKSRGVTTSAIQMLILDYSSSTTQSHPIVPDVTESVIPHPRKTAF